QGEWQRLADCYGEDARVRTTWFDGTAADFVAASREFFFSSRRRHTMSVSAFLLNRSSDLEFIAAVIAYYVHPVNIQTACLIMEGAEFTENIINGVERPVKAAELLAFTLRVRAGNTDVLTDAEENVRQKLRAEGVM